MFIILVVKSTSANNIMNKNLFIHNVNFIKCPIYSVLINFTHWEFNIGVVVSIR